MEKTNASLQQLDRARGYMHIADALRQEIRKMDTATGARLPSERELAQLLKVSRPSLREALIVLELQGEIEIRVGSGIYLKHIAPTGGANAKTPASTVDPGIEASLMGHSPRDVNQTRFFLESGVAAYAARFINREQLKALAASVAAMRKALGMRSRAGDKPLAEADRQFHVTLASTADNRLLTQTLEELFDQRYTPIGGSMHRLFDNQAVWQDAVQEHQDIYEAVADRDPLQAQAAMQRHLTRAHIRLMAVIG
ncbi:MAG: FadR family transcriptional regulator [Alcaligenaceae bacterium]|nr:FadR family transcriptional regulator [Alcaligenaceae bacterium]